MAFWSKQSDTKERKKGMNGKKNNCWVWTRLYSRNGRKNQLYNFYSKKTKQKKNNKFWYSLILETDGAIWALEDRKNNRKEVGEDFSYLNISLIQHPLVPMCSDNWSPTVLISCISEQLQKVNTKCSHKLNYMQVSDFDHKMLVQLPVLLFRSRINDRSRRGVWGSESPPPPPFFSC